MYCTNCGNEIAEGNQFCAFCGEPVLKFENSEKMQAENIQSTVSENKKAKRDTTIKRDNGNVGPKKKKRKRASTIEKTLSEYISFGGRMSNGKFWVRLIVVLILEMIFIFAFPEDFLTSVIGIIIWAIFFIVSFSSVLRRLHDTGRSGAYFLLLFVPIVNILLLIWLIQDGQPYTNQYGPDPKGRELKEFATYK